MSFARRQGLAAVLPLLVVVAIAALTPASTSAAVYWANGIIGAANLDGSQPNQKYFKPPFPSDSAGPECGLAVDPTHLYWAGAFGIGRVNLEGPAAPATIVSGLRQPCGIALGATQLYWANPEAGTISRANLDGSEVNAALLSGLSRPCDVAVRGDYLYWLDRSGIGRARLDGTEAEPGLVTTAGGCGLAADSQHLYWGEYGSMGRANLDGSEVDPGFITGVGGVAGIAVDGGHVYWTDWHEGMVYASIGRANLDGSGVVREWIGTERFYIGGVAVDSRPSPPPLPLPSRPFRFGQVRHRPGAGTLVVDVWVPARGDLALLAPRLGWKVLKGPPPPPYLEGSFRWRLKIWPGASRFGQRIRTRLRNKGWAKVALRASYAEEGQLPVTAVRRVTLLKRR